MREPFSSRWFLYSACSYNRHPLVSYNPIAKRCGESNEIIIELIREHLLPLDCN